MYPELPSIAGFALKTYAFCCGLAMFAAVLPVRAEARRLGWNVESMTWLVFTSTLIGWIGAHLLYMLTRLDLPADKWRSLLFSFGSGNVWYGGMLLSWLFVFIYARLNQLNVYRLFDVGAFAILIAQAVGRFGCLFGGCCYGTPTNLPWGISMWTRDYGQTHLHPVPIYESGYLLLAFAFLWKTRTKRAPGMTAVLYLVLTPLGRFLLEFVRGDRVRGFVWGWLSTSQAVALLLLLAAWVLYTRVASNARVERHSVRPPLVPEPPLHL